MLRARNALVGSHAAPALIKGARASPNSPTRNAIWDFSGADGASLNAESMKVIVNYVKEHGASRANSRVALVVDNTLSYRLGSMYKTLCAAFDVVIDYKVCKSIAEAKEWISQ